MRYVNVVFSGHRDVQVRESDLHEVAMAYPSCRWFHGDAEGFDSQVDRFARGRRIPVLPSPPNYRRRGESAPLARNRDLVSVADVVVVCWDGRRNGGTWYTLCQAEAEQKRRPEWHQLIILKLKPNGPPPEPLVVS